MSQHDYDLANQAGTAFRADLNSALAAIVSQNSGATAPATTFAYQWWADTTTGILKQRNAANSAWISLFTLSSGPVSKDGGNLTGGINSARGNITQHATTMDFFATTSPDKLDGTGSALTITGFVAAPQAGCERDYYPLAGTILTHGATFDCEGNANLTAAAGDCWKMETKTTTTCRVWVKKEDGTAVVGAATAWTDYSATSTIVGWSSYTTKSIYYKDIGKTRFVTFMLYGTSNSTSASFTLPSASSNTVGTNVGIRVIDNGVEGAIGLMGLLANSSTVTCYKSLLAAWTSSGDKLVSGQFFYDLP